MKSKTNKNRALYFKIGLALSLGVSLLAFEWKSYDDPSLVTIYTTPVIETPDDLPPITEYERPKPKTTPQIVEVKNEEIVDTTQVIEFIEFTDTGSVAIIDEPIDDGGDEIPEEKPDEVFHFLAEGASPQGGMPTFYKFIKKNLKYPRQAKRMGIQGKVFVKFVVDKTGELTNIQVIRGIGGGCDEEAVRILKKSPKWNPGKQRGKPVKQQMTFPINFKLK